MDKTEDRDAVVVTTGHAACYPCLRSLHTRGIHTIVATHGEGAPELSSRFCDEGVRIPSPDDGLLSYRDALVALAARPDVRTIIPTREEDVYVFSKYVALFENHVELIVPSISTLRTVQDRLHLIKAAEASGVPVPATRLLREVDDWSVPQIVKSRYNLLTDEYYPVFEPNQSEIIKTVEHLLPGQAPDIENLQETFRHEPIVQSFIPTTEEYMFAALYDHGEPLATYQHRQLRGDSYLGGGGVYRRSIYVPELEDVARRLLDHLDWHGLACIEYMRHPDSGEFLLTEINPRMWQSLASTVRADADFPYYYWLAATNRAEEIDPAYDLGVASHLLKGELGHLLSIRQDTSPHMQPPVLSLRALEIALSCISEPHFDYLRFDDPLPFIKMVGAWLTKRV